jgi:Malectin domain
VCSRMFLPPPTASSVKALDAPVLNALEIIPTPQGKIPPIRIVCQQESYTDAAGRLWKPDRYFLRGRLAGDPTAVQGTADPGLYDEERYGNFSYAIPVAEGRYGLTLFFDETYFGPDDPGKGGAGSRVFDVNCNGVALLRNFDIFKEAGGDNRAVVRTFHGLQPNAQGKLLLSFVPVRNYASLRALEVVDESR